MRHYDSKVCRLWGKESKSDKMRKLGWKHSPGRKLPPWGGRTLEHYVVKVNLGWMNTGNHISVRTTLVKEILLLAVFNVVTLGKIYILSNGSWKALAGRGDPPYPSIHWKTSFLSLAICIFYIQILRKYYLHFVAYFLSFFDFNKSLISLAFTN